ncbi:KAP family P-loop NTPase fold protein [Kocuria sp. LHG3120]|uniref:KAP family P-loop NTPase fold protein n=1 Tax=Kocuria sp. LHG3120 TaxID=2804590 RepID=UPI003CF0D0C1
MTNDIHSHQLYADTPVRNIEDDDILGRSQVVDAIIRALDRITQNGDSSVIALTGPWGSGKTSILNSLDRRLGNESGPKWNIVHHTPWMFSSPETAIRSLYEDLTAALGVVNKKSKAREKAAELFRKIAPFGTAGNVVGIDGQVIFQSAADFIEGDRSASELLRELSQEFATTEESFLVIMDDLDRLEPPELLNTFRTVRLLGRIPQVHYILSYDEETLTDLLCKTQLTPTPSRARAYLEKMTQLRIDVPPLSLDLRTNLFKAYLDVISAERDIKFTEDDDLRLHSLWYDTMSIDLDQPRTIKRYMGAVDNLWPGLESGLDFIDYMAMTYLRVQWKAVYDAIYESRYLLLGVRLDFSSSNSTRNQSEQWALKLQAMKLAESTPRLMDLTSLLFPALGESTKRWDSDESSKHRVGDPAHFEQYFQSGKHSNDVSDVAVARDLSLMLGGSKTHRYISDALRRAPEATLDALRNNLQIMPKFPSQRVFDALGSTYDSLMENAPPRDAFAGVKYERCGLAIVSNLGAGEGGAMLIHCLEQGQTRRLALRVCGLLHEAHERTTVKSHENIYENVKQDFQRVCRRFIRDSIGNFPYPISPRYVSPVVWDFHKSMADAWDSQIMWENCQLVEQFDWLMRMLVPDAFTDTSRAPQAQMVLKIDSLLGVDNVTKLCHSILTSTTDKGIPFPGSDSKTFGWHNRSANESWRIKRNMRKLLDYLTGNLIT